jgi:hypothetical protein
MNERKWFKKRHVQSDRKVTLRPLKYLFMATFRSSCTFPWESVDLSRNYRYINQKITRISCTSVFQFVIYYKWLLPFMKRDDTVMRNFIPVSERLLATLRFLATRPTFEYRKFTVETEPQTLSGTPFFFTFPPWRQNCNWRDAVQYSR